MNEARIVANAVLMIAAGVVLNYLATPAQTKPRQVVAEWTVMVYMDGDNDLEPSLLADFEEMIRVPDSEEVNVVVQLDRIPGFAIRYDDWSHTLRFKVRQGVIPAEQNALSPSEAELPAHTEVNMGDPEALASFVGWARKKYPAKRYILIIADHGDSWHFRQPASAQRQSGDAARRSDEKSLQGVIAKGQMLYSPHRSILMDDTDRDRLHVRELQTALERVLRGAKLDVIGFDACMMAMIENGFAMRRVANVMVGSEELEPAAGWDYRHWLAQLVSNPTINGATLGRLLVDSYRDSTAGSYDWTTLSAVNLSNGRIETLARQVSKLGDVLTANLNTELANIRAARNNCESFASGRNYHGIDLYRFCGQLASLTKKRSVRDRARAVLRTIKNTPVVLKAYAGPARRRTFGSHGLSIYFPKTKAMYDSDPFGYAYQDTGRLDYPVEFVQLHRWDNFLHAYFARVP